MDWMYPMPVECRLGQLKMSWSWWKLGRRTGLLVPQLSMNGVADLIGMTTCNSRSHGHLPKTCITSRWVHWNIYLTHKPWFRWRSLLMKDVLVRVLKCYCWFYVEWECSWCSLQIPHCLRLIFIFILQCVDSACARHRSGFWSYPTRLTPSGWPWKWEKPLGTDWKKPYISINRYQLLVMLLLHWHRKMRMYLTQTTSLLSYCKIR